MYLSKEKSNGIFYLYYKKYDGRMTRVSTKQTNKQKALQFQFEFKNGSVIKNDNFMMLKELVSSYLEYISIKNGEMTIVNKQIIYNEFINVIGNKPIHLITFEDVNKYVMQKIKHIKPITLNTNISKLKALFNYGIKKRILKENVLNEFENIPVEEKRRQALSKEEIKLLFSVVQSQNEIFLYKFALYTGLRFGELMSLKYENIRNNIVTVYHTKNKKIRELPLNNELLELIDMKKPADEYLFKRYSRTHVNRLFKKYCRMAELSNFHFHSLRHTMATHYINSNGNIFFLQKFLGHSSLKVTQIYLHHLTNEMKNSINLMSYR